MVTKRIYGLMAEFRTPSNCSRRRGARMTRATSKSTRFRRSRLKGWRKPSDFAARMLPLVVLLGGMMGCATGFFCNIMRRPISYPINVGRQAAQQLARIHSRDI